MFTFIIHIIIILFIFFYYQILWIETPTNPLLKVVDIKAASDIAHTRPGVIIKKKNKQI